MAVALFGAKSIHPPFATVASIMQVVGFEAAKENPTAVGST
jgi:hypothetical protein